MAYAHGVASCFSLITPMEMAGGGKREEKERSEHGLLSLGRSFEFFLAELRHG